MADTLQKFKEYLEELGYYEHVVNQLQWDLQTQTPKKGYDNKVEVMTHFSTEAFKMQTAQEYGQMLNALSEADVFEKLDEGMRVTVKRRKKSFEEDKRIPQDFYEEMVRANAHSERAWEEAKEAAKAAGQDEEKAKEDYFPLAYLFSQKQVSPIQKQA